MSNRKKSAYSSIDMDLYKIEKIKPKETISRPTLIGNSLFDSKTLTDDASSFEMCQPNKNGGKSLLQLQNPALMAFRNKKDKTSDNTFLPKVHLSAKMAPQRSSSLLFRKPLEALKPLNPANSVVLHRKKQDAEEQCIDLHEDPLAYFSRRKDGGGHKFIYMIPTTHQKSPDYNPYDLKKVPSLDPDVDEFFTISASDITRFTKTDSDQISLGEWAKETSIFTVIKKMKFFKHYFYWKPFYQWKTFVQTKHYEFNIDYIKTHPFFRNPMFLSFISKIHSLRLEAEQIIRSKLLCFKQSQEYDVEEFKYANRENFDTMICEFTKFIEKITNMILEMYSRISDPKFVQVTDNDFPDVRKRNPNIGQLLLLEKKKARARVGKTLIANEEIRKLANFVIMCDYMIVETLIESCIKSFREADENTSNIQAAVFQVEVYFNESGEVSFKPSLDVLLDVVTSVIREAKNTINTLPRLINVPKLRPFIRDGGHDLDTFYEKCCTMNFIMRIHPILEKVEAHIVEIIKLSYEVSSQHSRSMNEFYPIYQMGKLWNVSSYVTTRSGKPYTKPINSVDRSNETDEFLLNNGEEPIVDLDRVHDDILKFKNYIKLIGKFRAGLVKFALYIDSRKLKRELTPIPENAINDLRHLLEEISSMKVSLITNALNYYTKQLKKEPKTLNEFVQYCDVLTKTLNMMPIIQAEIDFVDKTYDLFDTFGFSYPKNQLHTIFESFKTNQQAAVEMKDRFKDPFINSLSDLVHSVEKKVKHYFEKATAIPLSLRDADLNKRLPSAIKMRDKVVKLELTINELNKFQNFIGIQLNNFSAYKNVLFAAEFAVKLYSCASHWGNISDLIDKKPFSSVNIDQFKDDLNEVHSESVHLHDISKTSYPLLTEISSKIGDVLNHITELELLSKGCLQIRHWNMLFEECGHTGSYQSNITISELFSLSIVENKESVHRIAATAKNENEFESKFMTVNNYWSKVYIPLVDQSLKNEECMLIGNTDKLYKDMEDAIITLQNMLSFQSIGPVRDQVFSLSQMLENAIFILKEWQIFQGNWVVLSSLFGNDTVRSILPHQVNRFFNVQRKWTVTAKSIFKDPRILNISTFPSLFDTLHENNQALESILAALGKYLDTRRNMMPRLYFLSNNEVLTLIASRNFSDFDRCFSKLFMNTSGLITNGADKEDSKQSNAFSQTDFQRLKVLGLRGIDGGDFILQKPILLANSIEICAQNIIEVMKSTVSNYVGQAVTSFTTSQFASWILSYPVYISIISLYVVFAREVEECFRTQESDTKSFIKLENKLSERINETTEMLVKHEDSNAIDKYSAVITILQGFKDKVSYLSSKTANQSHFFDWNQSLKLYYEKTQNKLTIHLGDRSYDHGLEYWGCIDELIFTRNVETAIHNVSGNIVLDANTLLTGSDSMGKQTIIKNVAMLFGKFLYVCRPFPDLNEYNLSKIIIGATASGSWLLLANIHRLTHVSSSYIFDNISNILTAIKNGNSKVSISSKPTDLDKSFRMFLTASDNYFVNNEIPAQIKSYMRPISVRTPDYIHYTEIKLASKGLTNQHGNAESLIAFIKSICKMLPAYLTNTQILYNVRKIIDIALTHHGDRFRSNPTLVLASASTRYFLTLVPPFYESLILKSAFNTFKAWSLLEEMVNDFQNLSNATNDKRIIEAAQDELNTIGLPLPVEYLASRVLALHRFMTSSNIIVISGPPLSGKTLVLDIYQKLTKKEELRDIVKPIEVLDCFPLADDWKMLFGSVINDSTLGLMWQDGYIHSILSNLMKVREGIGVMKFDGYLTPKLANFLTSFCSTSLKEPFAMNSLDTYSSRNIKIVLECDSDLRCITTSLMSKSTILRMNSAQVDIVPTSTYPMCTVKHPTIIFERARAKSSLVLTQEQVDNVRTQFCEIIDQMVKKVIHTPNHIYYMESNRCICDIETIIHSTVGENAAVLTFELIDYSKSDMNNINQAQLVVLYACFFAFSSILHEDQVQHFDLWIRNTFSTDTLIEWDDTVSEEYMRIFPKPSILSTRIFIGRVVAPQTSVLNKPPVKKSGQNESESSSPDSVLFNIAQHMPGYYQFSLYLRSNNHMFIYGEEFSGKSSFIELAIKNEENYTLIHVPTVIHSQEKFLCFIQNHSLITGTSNQLLSSKMKYILLFDNIRPDDTKLIEFIRMIIIKRSIPFFSPGDCKNNGIKCLNNFVVIVTTRSFKGFPARFISLFRFIQLSQLHKLTVETLITKMLIFYGYDSETANNVISMAFDIIPKYRRDENLTKLSFNIFTPLFYIEDKTDTRTIIKILTYQLYVYLLRKFDAKEYRDQLICPLSDNDTLKSELSEFLMKNIVFTLEYTTPIPLGLSSVKINAFKVNELKKELNSHLNVFNTNAKHKLFIRFSQSTAMMFSQLYSLLSQPGKNVVLKGGVASGRFSMTRLIADMNEADFVILHVPTNTDLLDVNEKDKILIQLLHDIIVNAVLYNKTTYIFGRAIKDYDHEIEVTYKAFSSRDIFSFFTQQDIDDLYSRLGIMKQDSPELKLNTYNNIRYKVSQYVHVVVAAEYDAPYIDSSFEILEFPEDDKQFYQDLFNDLISETNVKDILGEYAEVVGSLMFEAQPIASSYMSYYHRNSFYEFIDVFSNDISSSLSYLRTKLSQFKQAEEFYMLLQKDYAETKENLTSLEPELRNATIAVEAYTQSYMAKKGANESRRIELENEHRSRQASIKKLQGIISYKISECKILGPRLENAKESVRAVPPGDLEAVRITAQDPQISLKSLLIITAVSCGYDPDYDVARGFLEQKDFLEQVITNLNLENLTLERIDAIQNAFKSNELNVRDLDNIGQTAQAVYDYINIIRQLYPTKTQLEVDKVELERESKELEEFVEHMELEIESINKDEQSLQEEYENIESRRNLKMQLEAQYKGIEHRKELLYQTILNFEGLVEDWKKESAQEDILKKQCIGDSLIYAFYICFCGSISSEDRSSALHKYVSKIKETNILISRENPLDIVSHKLYITKSDDILRKSNTFIESSYNDLAHILSCQRPVLLIDPDQLVVDLLISSQKPKRFVVLSQHCSDLETILASAICDGKTVILTDCDELVPMMVPLLCLQMVTLDHNAIRDVFVGTKQATLDPRFRLVLSTLTTNVSKISPMLLSRVNIVNVSESELSMIDNIYTQTFVDFFSPNIKNYPQERTVRTIEHIVELYKYEKDTLDIIGDICTSVQSDPQYDYLENEETIVDFIKSKDTLIEKKAYELDFKAIKEEYENTIVQFKQHTNICSTFWRVATRILPDITPVAQFSYKNFIKSVNSIFVNEGLHVGSITPEQSKSLANALYQTIFQTAVGSLSFNNTIFYLFNVAFYSLMNDGRAKMEDLSAIIKHFREETESPPDCFSKLIEEGNPLDRLMHANIAQIPCYIISFIETVFGQFMKNIPIIHLDSVLSSTTNRPTFIFSPNDVDPTLIIHHILRNRGKSETFDSFSLSDNIDSIKSIKKTVTSYISRATCVILHYTKPSKAISDMITNIYIHMSSSSVNTNFKLIVICNSSDYLSPLMIRECKHIYIDNFPSVERFMLQVFQNQGVHVKCSTNLSAAKKFSYAIALVMSLMNFRAFISPIGLNYRRRADEILFKDLVSWLISLVDMHPNDIPVRNIRNKLVDFAYSGISDEFDLARLRAHVNQIFVPETQDDGFTIARNSNEAEIWAVPPDIPVPEFVQRIKNLPAIPKPEILKMDPITSTTLLNWNFSIYMSIPFLKNRESPLNIRIPDVLEKLDNFSTLLPEKIILENVSKFKSEVDQAFIREIKMLNREINFVENHVSVLKEELKRGNLPESAIELHNGNIPKKWRSELFIGSMSHFNKYTKKLIERHKYMMSWIETGFNHNIDVSNIMDIGMLMSTFLISTAHENNIPLQEAVYQFSFTSEKFASQPGEIILTGVKMLNGGIKDHILSISEKECHKAFQTVPGIKCTVTKKQSNTDRVYTCPFYKEAIIPNMNDEYVDDTTVDGVSKNLIWSMQFATDRPQREWIFAGTSLYARVPEKLDQ